MPAIVQLSQLSGVVFGSIAFVHSSSDGFWKRLTGIGGSPLELDASPIPDESLVGSIDVVDVLVDASPVSMPLDDVSVALSDDSHAVAIESDARPDVPVESADTTPVM